MSSVNQLTSVSTSGSDFQNGIVGFSVESLAGLVLDEDSENRKVVLTVQRQENRYGNKIPACQ